MSEPRNDDRLAWSATIHCLAGCGIGEVTGMVLGSAFGLPSAGTVAGAVVLAFGFGYALTIVPLLRSGMSFSRSARLALAADTVSIVVMEIVDNLVMLAIPGAMEAPLTSLMFWGSLAFALILAGAAAFPVNRWLLSRGRGHAAMHSHHRSESHGRTHGEEYDGRAQSDRYAK